MFCNTPFNVQFQTQLSFSPVLTHAALDIQIYCNNRDVHIRI